MQRFKGFCLLPQSLEISSNFNILQEFKQHHGRGDYKNFQIYEKTEIKIAQLSKRIEFLTKCKKERVIPKFRQLKVPLQANKKVKRFLHKANQGLLRERISDSRHERERAKRKCKTRLSWLHKVGDKEEVQRIQQLVASKVEFVNNKNKTTFERSSRI
jgi:hypothetical protein